MERRDIEIFLTLAEELHFGRTAERLGVSGARVSQTIKRLERRFGVDLFQRTSRKVTLTLVGSALRDDVQAGYQRIQDGIAKAVAAGRGFTARARVRPRLPAGRPHPRPGAQRTSHHARAGADLAAGVADAGQRWRGDGPGGQPGRAVPRPS
ncbi:helix-turn-helix domain-containing protein [Actinomadura oligospora]|uniref:helix-turn-helix domain-containing protein n=1 Tax=Actinomadura oligospora TaxID=111804 RepID=UPI001FDF9EB3|nr:LysR family transcriptional regulator [Actinomadura oligospora]